MHRGTKNKIRNKFRMSSPFRKLDDPSSGQGGSDPNQIFADTDYDTDITSETKTTGESVDNNRKIEKVKEASKVSENLKKANAKYDSMGNIIEEPKGIDRWIDKPILEVLGLTKKQREARKEKRAARVEEARKAEGEGTETLKQAKLVKRDDKRKARAEKRKARDKEKLAKFRKKNPKI